MRPWIPIILLLLMLPLAGAVKGEMKLLAVAETPGGMIGSTANLELEIRQGSGRVFIDSFPLTKIDTQISTRFATELACSYLNVDCTNLDFFYVIRSSSSIVGGPSAGAALAVLAISLLSNERIDDKMAITGTINSGGFIGPVSGLPEKLEAAKSSGIQEVLIPPGSLIVNESNRTINLSARAKELGIKIVEVSHIDEALALFKGEPRPTLNESLNIDPSYSQTMTRLGDILCNRTKQLMVKVSPFHFNSSMLEPVTNLTRRAEYEKISGGLYSRASYCFGANAKLSQLYAWKAYNRSGLALESATLKHQVLMQRSKLPSYKTLTDLETYTVVIERLTDSLDYVNRSFKALVDNKSKEAAFDLGYAMERFYSAQSWANFFGTSSQQVLDLKEMSKPCLQKLSEANERLDYLKVYISPDLLVDMDKDLVLARANFASGDFELCIFRASLLKAQVDAVLNSVGTSKEGLKKVLEDMLKYIRNGIVKQTKQGSFPIVGYSYFEYANSLKNNNIVSAFVYAEYALELSNLDMYFPKKEGTKLTMYEPREILAFGIGLVLGLAIGFGLIRMSIKTHPGARGTRSGKKR